MIPPLGRDLSVFLYPIIVYYQNRVSRLFTSPSFHPPAVAPCERRCRDAAGQCQKRDLANNAHSSAQLYSTRISTAVAFQSTCISHAHIIERLPVTTRTFEDYVSAEVLEGMHAAYVQPGRVLQVISATGHFVTQLYPPSLTEPVESKCRDS